MILCVLSPCEPLIVQKSIALVVYHCSQNTRYERSRSEESLRNCFFFAINGVVFKVARSYGVPMCSHCNRRGSAADTNLRNPLAHKLPGSRPPVVGGTAEVAPLRHDRLSHRFMTRLFACACTLIPPLVVFRFTSAPDPKICQQSSAWGNRSSPRQTGRSSSL